MCIVFECPVPSSLPCPSVSFLSHSLEIKVCWIVLCYLMFVKTQSAVVMSGYPSRMTRVTARAQSVNLVCSPPGWSGILWGHYFAYLVFPPSIPSNCLAYPRLFSCDINERSLSTLRSLFGQGGDAGVVPQRQQWAAVAGGWLLVALPRRAPAWRSAAEPGVRERWSAGAAGAGGRRWPAVTVLSHDGCQRQPGHPRLCQEHPAAPRNVSAWREAAVLRPPVPHRAGWIAGGRGCLGTRSWDGTGSAVADRRRMDGTDGSGPALPGQRLASPSLHWSSLRQTLEDTKEWRRRALFPRAEIPGCAELWGRIWVMKLRDSTNAAWCKPRRCCP